MLWGFLPCAGSLVWGSVSLLSLHSWLSLSPLLTHDSLSCMAHLSPHPVSTLPSLFDVASFLHLIVEFFSASLWVLFWIIYSHVTIIYSMHGRRWAWGPPTLPFYNKFSKVNQLGLFSTLYQKMSFKKVYNHKLF